MALPENRRFLKKAFRAELRLTLFYLTSTLLVGLLYLAFPLLNAFYEIKTLGNTTWIMPMRSE